MEALTPVAAICEFNCWTALSAVMPETDPWTVAVTVAPAVLIVICCVALLANKPVPLVIRFLLLLRAAGDEPFNCVPDNPRPLDVTMSALELRSTVTFELLMLAPPPPTYTPILWALPWPLVERPMLAAWRSISPR